MTFDWKNNKAEAIENVITEIRSGQMVNPADGIVIGHIFRNFPKITFAEEVILKGCIFEDCGEVSFWDENTVSDCTFRRVDTIFITRGKIRHSEFLELKCSRDLIISIEDSVIGNCRFDDIELYEKTFLCDGVDDCLIEHCEFANIQTDREDRIIINGKTVTGTLFTRIIDCDIVDAKTCAGVDEKGSLKG